MGCSIDGSILFLYSTRSILVIGSGGDHVADYQPLRIEEINLDESRLPSCRIKTVST